MGGLVNFWQMVISVLVKAAINKRGLVSTVG
jgi:hypothetical protein